MSFRLSILWPVATLLVAGCGGTSAEPLLPATIDLPASWTADGKSWAAQPAMSPSDEELLTKFFHVHSAFQGSSDFEGVPRLMTAGKSDRRFFWIRGSGESMAWSCVHFEDGKFRTSEGHGNPFLK